MTPPGRRIASAVICARAYSRAAPVEQPGCRRGGLRDGGPASAGDDVVDRGDHRLAWVDPGRAENRHQRRAKRLERLGRVPDVKDLQPVLALERGVVAAPG